MDEMMEELKPGIKRRIESGEYEERRQRMNALAKAHGIDDYYIPPADIAYPDWRDW
jgi:hypothetical protein